jgi:hypothetical protein
MDADGIPNGRDADANGDGILDNNPTGTTTTEDSSTSSNTTNSSSNTTGASTPTTSETSIVAGSTRTETVLDEQEQAQLSAQTGNPALDIVNGNVPLGSATLTGAWSLANMLMAQIAAVLAIIIGMLLLLRRGRRGAVTALRAFVCVLGISAPFVWLANDHLNDPMVWFNSWTPVLAVLLLVQTVVLVVSVVSLFVNRREEIVMASIFDEFAGIDENSVTL